MQHYRNVTIIGTSHIAENSVLEVESEFKRQDPGIVAIELDRGRLHALIKNEKPSYSPRLIGQIGMTGYFFAVIGGLVQKRLGSLVGMNPGSEMLAAANLARNAKKKVALIDQDVRVTLRRLSQEFSFREKMRLLWDLIASPFSGQVKIDLRRVPEKELVRKLISMLKKRYPGIYKALIHERNHFMASRLCALALQFPGEKIIAVVGAGHEEEIAKLLEQKMGAAAGQEKLI